MNRAVKVIPLCFSLVLLGSSAHAQIGGKKPHDVRVMKLLDAEDLKYEITSDGDFKLGNRFKNGRTHLLWVNSNTEKYQKLEIREVWSVGYIANGKLSPEEMRTLLKDNSRKKLGSWKIITSNEKDIAVFYVQIAADSDRDSFLSAVQIVSESADEMEKQLTGKDDL